MSSFKETLRPTPFGFFDADPIFSSEADSMVTFVKRKLGDDILSVELTKKQIWSCFEESFLEYGRIVLEAHGKSQLTNLLGIPTGSLSGAEALHPRQNLEFALRAAEPYAGEAGVGGSYSVFSGSIDMKAEVQDYDIYETLKDGNGDLVVSSSLNSPRTKLKVLEVCHFSPQNAYRFFDTTSAINYLNNEFSFESFTPETVFYVLPVFEDILRAGQMDISNRIRRSNYSYKLMGGKLRIYPIPQKDKKLWIKFSYAPDPINPQVKDDTIYGVSNLSNVPFGNLNYSKINEIGRQWVRQYALALSKELLGLVRSKFSSVPLPDGDLSLNGTELISQGREDQSSLRDKMTELLDTLSYGNLLKSEAESAEAIQTVLKSVPIPLGKAITLG
tara:strand:- start:2532 stop:3695 length:1164 start_codon:yes stop_codon:yes gene_type:complete